MVGAVLAIIKFATPATWLIGLSPGVAPIYAATVASPPAERPNDLLRAMPRAFWFWQTVTGLVTVRLVVALRCTLRRTARKAREEEPEPERLAA